MGFWQTVLAGVVTLVLGGALTLAWQNRHQPGHWFAKQEGAAAKAKRILSDDALKERRRRVVEVAKEKKIQLPASAHGHNPTTVTWADGTKSWHFSDFATYKRRMNERSTDLRRSHPGPFTGNPVSRWPQAEVEEWLAQHDTD